jgi:acetylornithine/N-succinyldiaminopimelate aminotransferase
MNDFELDKLYIAGTYKRFPVEIVSGKGSIVEDNNGKKYIDMGSGIGVTAFGIADEQWIKAVDDQIHKIQHMSNLYYTEPDIKLAQMLCQRTGMKKVFFCNSGAESNECAIKVARKYAAEKYGSDRYTIVTLKNSFHGRTLTTLAATGQDVFHKLFQPLTPGFACIDPGDIDQLKAIHEKTPIAGVLIECIQGEGGVMPLDKEFVKALYEYCQEKDIVFMVDEVQTGNGRSGHLYSYMAFDVKPDVVSTAKGLAGGLPFGATMMGEKCENILGPGDHGSTFGGNPVCSAAALSVLSRIDDGLLADVRAKSKYIFDQLSNAEGVESVSGMGLMIGIKTKKAAIDVVNECIEKGVLCLTAKDRVRLLPALNIPMEVLKVAVEVIQDSCAD